MTRLLALVPGGLSDQLLFFPTLDQLDQHYPDAQIDVVVEPRAKAAYTLTSIVDKVIPFDFSGRTGPADWANLIGVGRDREYDAVFYTGTNTPMGLLLWLMGIPQRFGFAGNGSDLFYTDVIAPVRNEYLAHTYHRLLEKLGIEQPCPGLHIELKDADRAWAAAECQRLGIDTEASRFGLLHGGIHPRTSAADLYPLNSWTSLVQGMQERRPDLPLMVVAGSQAGNWTATLTQQVGGLKVSTPQTLGQLGALIERAELLICPDSAPMHLAVAVQTKVIALFGSSTPEVLLPADHVHIGLKSTTGNIGDIPPIQVLEKLS